MERKIDFRIIKNYTEGKYSFRDFKLIIGWFEDYSCRSEIEAALQQHWDELPLQHTETEKDLSQVFERLQKQIMNDKPVFTLRQRVVQFYARAAAVLLLPLLFYATYTLFPEKVSPQTAAIEIYSPLGARTRFQLPDGSNGWLNSGARLSYISDFEKERQVELSGEAYFDVVHHAQKPFVVTTPQLKIEVLGTKFNVAAPEGESFTEVVLAEGKVRLTGRAADFSQLLDPDEKFVFDQQKKRGEITRVNAAQLTAWKDGILIFRNEPLEEVFKRLGRWYNVRFELDNEQLRSYRFRATFENETVEEVVRLIALTVPISWEMQERVMNPDGTWSPKIIQVKLKDNGLKQEGKR